MAEGTKVESEDTRRLRLPAWAQELITNLERERRQAVKALHDFTDQQTEGAVYFEEWVSDGATGKGGGPSMLKRYLRTDNIKVFHAGVELRILLRPGRSTAEGPVIDVTYSGGLHKDANHVVLQPRSFQQFYLFAPVADNTRSV